MSAVCIRYVCKYCQKSHKLATELIQHKKQHHAEEVAKLRASFRAADSERNRDRGEGEEKENKFDQSVSNKTEFSRSLRKSGDTAKLNLNEDQKASLSFVKEEPAKKNLYQCRFCKKILRRIAERIRHERTHTGDTSHRCKICNRAFAWRTSLTRHIKNRSCALTEELGKPGMKSKRRAQPGPKPRPEFQSDFNAPLPSASSLPSGTQTNNKRGVFRVKKYSEIPMSNGQLLYKCIFCLEEHKILADAIEHSKTHKTTESVICRYSNCNARFTRVSTLESHVRRCHTGDLPFKCNQCNHRYATHAVYLRHVKSSKSCAHARVLAAQKKVLAQKKSMQRKKKRVIKASSIINNFEHNQDVSYRSKEYKKTYVVLGRKNGEDQYSCKLCKVKFTGKYAARNAVQHTWSHTKPFKCSHCGKNFARRENVVSHESIHTGEKHFSCKICGKYYRWKSSVRGCRKAHELAGEVSGIE